jgi:hypothetical protein
MKPPVAYECQVFARHEQEHARRIQIDPKGLT